MDNAEVSFGSGSPEAARSSPVPVSQTPSIEELVVRLWREPELGSRNRHYDRFRDPRWARALRRYRALRALDEALAEADRVRVEPDGEGYAVEIERRRLRAVQRTHLSPRLLALLAREGSNGERIARALAEAGVELEAYL